ncbi:ferredoxin--NADP reductase, root isozyme, chloroplastic-like [Iris pallida]|uniref:Ferredoxin--NADP reductase, root isozyme, chloroplastic-like n=1 Tax=Iris pallida TaxID=29817 RepID=A0AAX6EMS9_IRIPA|nr:ferredoxin--NADP reductase, root isozyme, chloroplastic-like [Iris pallida]KAJ6805343.1 ferredoxin--NADP reductase, root isozyme, chloroplastic-like [Iris pallida]
MEGARFSQASQIASLIKAVMSTYRNEKLQVREQHEGSSIEKDHLLKEEETTKWVQNRKDKTIEKVPRTVQLFKITSQGSQ